MKSKKLSSSTVYRLMRMVRSVLSDDLRSPQYRGHHNINHGQCYVAAEALYHLTRRELLPCHVRLDDGTVHWFLRYGAVVVDPTADQFSPPITYRVYGSGIGSGFLSREPSIRAREVMRRVSAALSRRPVKVR